MSATDYLSTIKWGTGNGKETTSTIGTARVDVREPPSVNHIAGLQITRYGEVLLAMTDYFAGGQRVRMLATTSNQFGVGEYGIHVFSDGAVDSRIKAQVKVNNVDTYVDVPAAAVSTKGDILAYTGTRWVKLAAGTNGYALVADSTATSGLAWSSAMSAVHAPAASTTAIKAIPVAERGDGMMVINTATGDRWWFSAGSSAGASSSVLVPDVGTGRWLLDPSTIGVSAAASAEALATAAQGDATTALADAAAAAAKVPKVVSVTITHADLTAVATSQTLTVGAVPAGARYACLTYVISPLFSGGGVATLDMDLGWSGTDNAILDGSGVGLDLIAGTPAAALNVYNTQSGTVGDPRTIAGKTVTATFTCDGGHTLDQLAAGSVFLEITYFVPA